MTVSVLAMVLLTAALGWWIFTAEPSQVREPEHEIELQALLERRKAVYDNLKDLHFEHLAGKLSEPDFQRTRAMLEAEAAAIVQTLDRAKQR